MINSFFSGNSTDHTLDYVGLTFGILSLACIATTGVVACIGFLIKGAHASDQRKKKEISKDNSQDTERQNLIKDLI